MINAQNHKICESTTLDVINWSDIDWYKTNKYVVKQQRRIYDAECNNDYRKTMIIKLLYLDKSLLEPMYVERHKHGS